MNNPLDVSPSYSWALSLVIHGVYHGLMRGCIVL